MSLALSNPFGVLDDEEGNASATAKKTKVETKDKSSLSKEDLKRINASKARFSAKLQRRKERAEYNAHCRKMGDEGKKRGWEAVPRTKWELRRGVPDRQRDADLQFELDYEEDWEERFNDGMFKSMVEAGRFVGISEEEMDCYRRMYNQP